LLDNKAIGAFNDGFCIYAYIAHLFVKYFFWNEELNWNIVMSHEVEPRSKWYYFYYMHILFQSTLCLFSWRVLNNIQLFINSSFDKISYKYRSKVQKNLHNIEGINLLQDSIF
jgi:hypothetical protein